MLFTRSLYLFCVFPVAVVATGPPSCHWYHRPHPTPHNMKTTGCEKSIASELDQIADFVLSDDDDASWDETLGNDRGEPLRQKKYYEGDAFFINGGASNFVRAGHMPVIAEYFPNYMLTTIRGAGHWVHAEAPDDTLALLKRYLDR